jgi:hypothetical protein
MRRIIAMTSMHQFLRAALLLCGLCGSALATPPPAAFVTLSKGEVTAAESDGAIRPLVLGDAVYSGETLNTGPTSVLAVKFSDGGIIVLRPGTRFEIADYVDTNSSVAAWAATVTANPSAPPSGDSGSHAFFSLLKGGFRAVSGSIGKAHHPQYRVQTPVATVGVRGTDYIAVICDAACVKDPVVAASVLPSGAHAEGGLVSGVVHGRIAVGTKDACPDQPKKDDTANNCAEIGERQYLLTTADGQQLLLAQQPMFLKSDPLPDPRSCAQ